MPVELSVEGQGLKALQHKLKALDSKDLRRELNKGLRDGAKPLLNDARDAARSELPHAGGLADRIASAPMSISVGQGRVKVRVRGMDARNADRGRLRHPTYGHRDRWVTQAINPGWFTERMRREAPKVRPELVKAVERIAEQVARA